MVETIRQARAWLKNVSFAEFKEEIEERVIGQPDLVVVLAQVRNYIEAIGYGRPINHNIIIAAPSGSGKTETYRALRTYFEEYIPLLVVSIVDISQITAAGFRGAEPYEIVRDFFRRRDPNPYGLCFLDELDKKLLPSYSAHGNDTNAETQSNLLTIIEGSTVSDRQGKCVDTSRIMFVGMGSFDKFRDDQTLEANQIGFGAKEKEKDPFCHITKEDMVKSGALHELIGRFPIVVNYDSLSEDNIRKVIEKIAFSISETFGCDLDIGEKYETYLLEHAASRFGCREIDSLLRESVLREYAKTLDEDKKGQVLIIELIDKDNSSHKWREPTTREKKLNDMISDFVDDTDVFS